jgi:prephenate dehydrogenase
MTPLHQITILGGGLLGGSLAMACAAPYRAVLWSRRQEATTEALSLGIDATSDLALAVRNADLLVLCVPVGHMAGLLQQAIDAGLPRHCIVTDVGSVKRQPHETLRPLVQSGGLRFIGSHPMAGGEKGGIAQARADLFQQAACLLTNDEGTPREDCDAVEQFWKAVGCRTAWGTASEHDAIVARVSHFPHLLASVGATVGLKKENLGQYCGGGLRDTTRVASGNPVMWAEILLENRDELLRVVREAQREMETISHLLEAADSAAVEGWLAEAKKKRDGLSI